MDPYSDLFEAYVKALRSARHEALRWWGELLAREASARGNEAAAEQAIRLRWPLGPTAYPRVIAVYRHYYLAIEDLNRNLVDDEEGELRAHPLDDTAWRADEEQAISVQHPRAVLYERLDEVDVELARFMDHLLFVPIGADHDGRLM